jgi:hypothetical protein
MNIWRKEYEEGVEVIMPHRPILDDDGQYILDDDGNQTFITTRVRSITSAYVLDKNRLPSGLLNTAIMALVALGIVEKDDDTPTVTSLEMAEGWVEFQKFIINEMVIYPKVVETPKKDDEISYEMLTSEDLMFYVSLIEQPLANLRPFHLRPKASLETLPASESNEVPEDAE